MNSCGGVYPQLHPNNYLFRLSKDSVLKKGSKIKSNVQNSIFKDYYYEVRWHFKTFTGKQQMNKACIQQNIRE